MNWFEEWFDSPLYERLYANRDEKEAARLVQLLEETLPLEERSNILDLGCGRGRHSISLYNKGYKVTGIDLSEQAIQTAREKAAKQGLEGLDFEVRDMREPLPKTFDAIVNLFTTFGYFKSDEENAGVFDSVRAMLRPGGIFVQDFLNAEKVKSSFEPNDRGSFRGIHYEIKRFVEDNAIHKEITFSGDQVGEEKKYSERVKLYSLPWFKREMKKRNLIIDHIFGDYDGNEFDPKTSPRLLMISHLRKE